MAKFPEFAHTERLIACGGGGGRARFDGAIFMRVAAREPEAGAG